MCLIRGNNTRALHRGVTLLEVLVATSILALLLVMMLGVVHTVSASYRRTTGRLEAFSGAQNAFEAISRHLRQATLASRLGYDTPSAPTAWQRYSDLHFFSGPQTSLGFGAAFAPTHFSHAVFFHAPLGIAGSSDLLSANSLLTAAGFFLAWGPNPEVPKVLDGLVPNPSRFRLYHYQQPREKLRTYGETLTEASEGGAQFPVADHHFSSGDWFLPDVASLGDCHRLADNIVFLAIVPIIEGQVASSYVWNSRDRHSPATLHRLPDALRIVMIAIDESDMARLGDPATPPDFLPEDSEFLTSPATLAADIAALTDALNTFQPALNYRLFQADIPLTPSPNDF